MEWNQLHKFVTAAKEENLSKAAEILDISQPSLSLTIKRLEEELGYPLFDREGKRIKLNESGRIMLQTCIQIEELMQNTKIRLEELNKAEHPEVSIHFGSASTLLPELLLYLRARNPQIQYQIHQWQAPEAGSGDDIQILAGPVPKHPCEILLEEEICLALPSDHVLLEKEEIFLKDLVREEFISLNDQWTLGREIRQEMERLLFCPKTTMLVDNPNMMRELLKSHIGIAFVPAVSWHSFAGEEIVLRPVADFKIKRFVYLHTKPRKYLTKEQKECISGIQEFFKQKYQFTSQLIKMGL